MWGFSPAALRQNSHFGSSRFGFGKQQQMLSSSEPIFFQSITELLNLGEPFRQLGKARAIERMVVLRRSPIRALQVSGAILGLTGRRLGQAAFFVLLVASMPALANTHPVPLDRNVDSAQCIGCHEDKTKGKVVHSVIATGCLSCHEVRVNKDVTRVKLITTTRKMSRSRRRIRTSPSPTPIVCSVMIRTSRRHRS
jgi:hypothetical protein